MQIAVASKTGTEVDQHFGHAQRFLVFDYASGNPQPIREVTVEPYSSADVDHPFRPEPFNAIVSALAGCKVVVTEMIGAGPKQELEKAGIKSIVTTGPIAAALKLAHDSLCSNNCHGENRANGCCLHV
jgi:predicted Fe-Mo cluster-binding NifX family protein